MRETAYKIKAHVIPINGALRSLPCSSHRGQQQQHKRYSTSYMFIQEKVPTVDEQLWTTTNNKSASGKSDQQDQAGQKYPTNETACPDNKVASYDNIGTSLSYVQQSKLYRKTIHTSKFQKQRKWSRTAIQGVSFGQ